MLYPAADGLIPSPINGLAQLPRRITGPGRPRSIIDMRAYKAQKQREYRQRRAAEKEAGK